MTDSSSNILGRFLLHPGELLRLDLDCRHDLRCDQGRLWVTAGQEGLDHELLAGHSVPCGRGMILVEGEGELLVERVAVWPWLAGQPRIRLIGAHSH